MLLNKETRNLGNVMNPLIPPSYDLNDTTTALVLFLSLMAYQPSWVI